MPTLIYIHELLLECLQLKCISIISLTIAILVLSPLPYKKYVIVHDAMVDRHVCAAQNHIGVQWVGSLFPKVNSCYKGHDHL